MQSAHAVFECRACRARREVTVTDDGATTALPDDEQARAKRVRELLRHATCPACQTRDPEAVDAHQRDIWHGRLYMAAFYAGIAFVSFFVSWFALIPPVLGMLLWLLALKIRIRRRFWSAILLELVMFAAMTTWIVVVTHRAYVVPATMALLSFWPRRSSSDPFADATEQLRFAESPYRG